MKATVFLRILLSVASTSIQGNCYMLTQLEQTSEENILPLNNSYMTWEGEASYSTGVVFKALL